MKRIVWVLVTVCALMLNVSAASEGDTDVSGVLAEYAKLYGAELSKGEEILEASEIRELVPGFNPEEVLLDIAEGETVFSVGAIVEKSIALLWGEIRHTAKFLVLIMAIAVLCTYLTGIQNSIQQSGAADAAFFVCYLVISGIAAASLLEIVGCGKKVVGNISVFMRIMVPVIVTTLVSSGAPVSASTFELVMIGIIEVSEWIVEVFFIPMLMMTAALSIVNNLSDSINAEKLVQFINKVLKWGIGIMMIIFVGVMSLQGIVSGGADGLALKITKFATSNLIPVVGGALAETVSTVIGCGAVIKNSVGVLGIIAVVLMAAIPMMKIAACLIMFRLGAAVLQPVSDKRIVKCMSELADTVSAVFGLVAAVTVMFVIILTIVIRFAG